MIEINSYANSTVLNPDTVRVGFLKILPPATDFRTSYGSLTTFGTKWGRGLMLDFLSTPYSIVCSYYIPKELLLARTPEGAVLEGMFYWGFDEVTNILYLDYEDIEDTFLRRYAIRRIVSHELLVSSIDLTS